MARQRKMTPERRAFINSLLEHYKPSDANDVQEMLKDLLGDTLQGMLEAEMDEKLGYSKYDYQNKQTDDALFKMLYLAMMDATKKWTGKTWDWGLTLDRLCIYFADRITPEDLY